MGKHCTCAPHRGSSEDIRNKLPTTNKECVCALPTKALSADQTLNLPPYNRKVKFNGQHATRED